MKLSPAFIRRFKTRNMFLSKIDFTDDELYRYPVTEYLKEGNQWRVLIHYSTIDIRDNGLIDQLPRGSLR